MFHTKQIFFIVLLVVMYTIVLILLTVPQNKWLVSILTVISIPVVLYVGFKIKR